MTKGRDEKATPHLREHAGGSSVYDPAEYERAEPPHTRLERILEAVTVLVVLAVAVGLFLS